MNVSEMLAEQAARRPDAHALIFHGKAVTYASLDDAAGRAAAAFRKAGIEPGDRIALVVGNVPEFVSALYGTWRAGAVAVPLNVMLTSEELRYILADAGAKGIVTQMQHLPAILDVRDDVPSLESIFVVAGPPVPSGTVSFEAAMGAEQPVAEGADPPDGLALIQYTSGTTADPKGAMLGHDNLMANMAQMEQVPSMRIVQDDVVLLVLPVFHIYALNVILGMTIREGGTVVLVERFDPTEALDIVEQQGVTLLPGAPPMYVQWLDQPQGRKKSFASVRIAVSGAAPLAPETFQRFKDRFNVTIWDSYGLTEAGPAVTSNAVGDRARPGSIGLPIPDLQVRLVEQGMADLEDVEDGDPGEIVVQGPAVFRGYWDKPEATSEVLTGDGWLRTGDVAYADEDGYLYLVDRTKDLIIVNGFNVFPREVEDALVRLPGVTDAVVIGVPDQRTGEAVKALVVLEHGVNATPQSLIDGVGRYLARFKVPREIDVVDELPRHPTGKVLRRALRGEEVLGGGEQPSS
ncbi:MAG TPA: long-chain fatty acid--CoA ligase [Actinomycetota bacterium]|nr:long-chain fatty acid--CoA ligase [Actinomycetota bacterium]